MYFCEDVDLMAWEPGVFLEGTFAHQAILSAATGMLTGTGLVMDSAVLGNVAAGMVAKIELADDSLTQLLEILAVADATHATVSALRGRGDEAAVGPLVGGSVKVTVVSFRPQIAAVGDGLLALIGVASDRETEPTVATEDLRGFRTAAAFGTLAAIFRTLSSVEGVTEAMKAKQGFYEKLFETARRSIGGRVDEDGDGVAETRVEAGVGRLIRD